MNLESIKIDKKDVVKVLYVPMTSMRRAVELIENPLHFQNDNCKRNLAVLQESKSLHQTEFKERNPRNIYRMALRQAIYSHRWNHLAYLLKKSPIWEQDRCHDLRVYIRALAILLMNHPTAKAQSLLQEYSHMVLALRTEPDKKALHKIILTLTQKLYSKAQKKSSHNAFEANF